MRNNLAIDKHIFLYYKMFEFRVFLPAEMRKNVSSEESVSQRGFAH